MGELPWAQIAIGGPLLIFCCVLVWAVIKLAPTWQTVRLRQLEAKEKEAQAQQSQAAGLGLIASALTQQTTVTREFLKIVEAFTLEQRKTIERLEIMYRVGHKDNERLTTLFDDVNERLTNMEQRREAIRKAV